MNLAIIRSHQSQGQIAPTHEQGGRQKSSQLTIMNFLMRTIIFHLNDMLKTFIDDINSFVRQRETSISFMAQRKILIDIKGTVVLFG